MANDNKNTIVNSKDMVEGKLYRALGGTGNTFMVLEVNAQEEIVSLYNVTTMQKTALVYGIATPEMEVIENTDAK